MSDDLPPVTQAWSDAFMLSAFEVSDQLKSLATSAERDVDPIRVLEAIIGFHTAAATATGVAIRKLEERIAALEAAAGIDGNA